MDRDELLSAAARLGGVAPSSMSSTVQLAGFKITKESYLSGVDQLDTMFTAWLSTTLKASPQNTVATDCSRVVGTGQDLISFSPLVDLSTNPRGAGREEGWPFRLATP